MQDILITILFRILCGCGLALMGGYLVVETIRELGSPFYFFTSVCGLFALVFGCFCIVWDGWK